MGIKYRSILWATLAFLPALAVAADVPALTVQRGAGSGGFEIDGTLQALRQATVAAQVGGNVLQLAVKAGDRVKAGQLLARIDERDTAAGLQRSEAAVAQAQAEATNARINAERTRELRAQGFVSQAALDVAQTQWQAVQAALQQAQAGRTQATLARGFAAVTAPFDGIVLATHLDTGDLATPGRPVATVYAPGALRAVVLVGVSRAEAARTAKSIDVDLPNGKSVTPIRRTELGTTDPVSQTIEWRLDLPPVATEGAMPGQVVRVRFVSAASASAPGAAEAPLLVPAAAVLRRGELTAVYVAQGDAYVLRAVRLGADRGAQGVTVLAGLKPGERIAADAMKAGLVDARPAK
ncbi:MAG: efflux RND transporter periplasmic adaptor subunit [Rubrivivax sp.]|nr:efflux RND transporter periplasmic adaptor subunit [Rubrivivax sp.]